MSVIVLNTVEESKVQSAGVNSVREVSGFPGNAVCAGRGRERAEKPYCKRLVSKKQLQVWVF